MATGRDVGAGVSLGSDLHALSGVTAGRLVDRLGAPFIILAALAMMLAGCLALALLPPVLGLAGYVAAIAVLTPGYALFQAANNTAVMMGLPQDRRGAISGLLSLSRNLGLITGASVMGAVFAAATAGGDVTTAQPAAVAAGMRVTFAVAGALILVALAVAVGSRALVARPAAAAGVP